MNNPSKSTSTHEPRVTEEKRLAVGQIRKSIEDASHIVFTDYRGLTVEQVTELGRRLRQHDTVFRVVKNRYTAIAFSSLEGNFSDARRYLVGPTALALIQNESGPVLKELIQAEAEWSMSIKGSLIEGRLFDDKETAELAKLPGRKELLSRLAGSIASPATGIARTLKAVAEKLARTMKAIVEQKEREK